MKLNSTRRKGSWLCVIAIIAFIMQACQPEELELFTEIETVGINEVGPTHCIMEGEILEIGDGGVLQHGYIWSESPDPILQTGMINTLGAALNPGIFNSTLKGLKPSTTYFVRAYATGVSQTAYGAEMSFTTTPPTVPLLHTIDAFEVGMFSAYSGGIILSDGGADITSVGLCWSPHSNPRIDDNYTVDDIESGRFESKMIELEPYTEYFMRAYAINNIGIAYGEKFAFRTLWDNSEAIDMDGNVYATVQIGDQVWLAENLRSVTYSNGSSIPLVESSEEWAALGSDSKAYCHLGNSELSYETYGTLYTWQAAMNGEESSLEVPSGVQGVCPAGWHLPSDKEWGQLEMEVGLGEIYTHEDGWRGWEQGGKLKQSGTDLWKEPNDFATNESGFSALPAGFRDSDGAFHSEGSFTAFWSSSGGKAEDAGLRGLHAWRGEILRENYPASHGFSVRCLKDR